MDAYLTSGSSPQESESSHCSPALVSIRSRIAAEFERTRKLHERPRPSSISHVRQEFTLADKAEPILRRIMTTPTEHRRRDCVSYEIVEPNVHDLNALFDEALASLGFKPEVARVEAQ